MEKTVLNIKIDRTLKAKAQKVAKKMGLPLGTIMNHYLRELVQEKRVIFSAYPELKPEKKKFYTKIEKDIKERKNLSPIFSSAGEMDKYLDSLK